MNNADIEKSRRTSLYAAARVADRKQFAALSREAQEKAAKAAASELNMLGVKRPNGARWDKNTVRVSV